MRTVVVATDFSTRSDRAIRRGVLISKVSGAELVLVHAIDDDQPQRLIDAAHLEAKLELAPQVSTLRTLDGVNASYRICIGDPFSSITQTAHELGADVLVVGPHRRQILRDVFVGTSAERIVRTSGVPVIMANATPAAPYRHILVAVDYSQPSTAALELAGGMRWGDEPALSVVHVFDPPAQATRGMLIVSEADAERYIAEARLGAAQELAEYVRRLGVQPVRQIVEMMTGDYATTLIEAARRADADLIVLGQRGQSGLAKALMGSVAEAVLRLADIDVLAAPRLIADE